MAKLKMKWVRIYALREQRKPLLEWLQRAGMLEIETAEEPEEGFGAAGEGGRSRRL